MITFRIVVSLSSFYSPLHFSFARFGRRLNSPLSIAGSSRRNEKNGARSTRRGEARSGNNHRGGEKEEEKYWVAGRLSSSKLIKHHTLSLSLLLSSASALNLLFFFRSRFEGWSRGGGRREGGTRLLDETLLTEWKRDIQRESLSNGFSFASRFGL